MTTSGTGKLIISARFLVARVSFIATIATVIFAVTFPAGRYTATVLAGKLVRLAGNINATSFIRVIAAIIVRVALESNWHAATG